MNWAPVTHVASISGRQWGSLNIVDSTNVEWMRFGTVYRRYSMESPVQAALFTRFAHAQDPNETWVVVVCKDRLVHSYSTESGRHYIVGITFIPTSVLSCPEQGILFTFASPTRPSQQLHLLQGPEELLGSVVPSSVCAPLSKSDRVLHFNEHYAVVWDPERLHVRVYTVRFIHHRLSKLGVAQAPGSAGSAAGSAGSAGSAMSSSFSTGSLSIESLNKVAVIQLAREWRQSAVGRIFSQSLGVPGTRLSMVVIHDPVDDALFAFCDGELIMHSDVTYACPVAGVHGIPGVVMAFKDKLQFTFLLFPQTPLLGLPVPNEYRDLVISGLESEPLANWVDVRFESQGSCRVQLAVQFGQLVDSCLSIVQHVSGPMETAFWVTSLLAQRLHTNDYWEALEMTIENLIPEMDAAQVSNIVSCLHLLREELSVCAGSCESSRLLRRVIQKYVVSWGPAWTDSYGIPPSELSFEIPCSMESPPNIYSALICKMQTHSGQNNYPEIANLSSLYPKTGALLNFFQLLSVETPVDDMQRYLVRHFSGSNLAELAPAVKLCVLEVAEYLDLKLETDGQHERQAAPDDAGPSQTSSRPLKWLKSEFTRVAAQGLFPLDRRFNEAVRLLQTKGPQQCAFGSFYDTELISDHEIAYLQAQWGQALAERALASAFGRAALELDSRNPVVWEQLDVPAIEFGGECTATGLSISPFYKSLEQASFHASWGIFAHGVALGMSIRPDSPGVNSLWVITSAKLKAANDALYAGFVFGTGLMGHLAGLEEWQFYESLVSSNAHGTVAALLGVAASKRGSRDPKLTKVFSVHIRALLPEPARSEPLVGPEEERAAIISLGLLYKGQGVRHLTEVLSRELKSTQPLRDTSFPQLQAGPTDPEEAEQMSSDRLPPSDDEDYSLALGLALGLINSGRRNLSELLPLVTRVQDRTTFSPGVANGALCAILLSYVGSNAKLVAAQVQLPSSRRAAIYSMPSTLFTKALVHHLIMWDEIGSSPEWVAAQIPADMYPTKGQTDEVEDLWYIHALAGVLTAMALRRTATNDTLVVGVVLDYVESVFYPEYARLLSGITAADTSADKRVSYDSIQAAKSVAQLIGALCLAVAAVAAGSGNIRVLQVLRVAYQISPQVQASQSPHPILAEGVGIDPVCISEAIGWLFMGGGQWSFRTDPESVGLLASISFLPLLGGPGIQAESWYHLRFLWVLLAERRCLYAASDPTEQVNVEIVLKSGSVIQERMPTLMPPLSDIREIRVVDAKYRPFATSDISSLTSGLPVVRHSGPEDTLDTHLLKCRTDAEASQVMKSDSARGVAQVALEVLQYVAKHIESPEQLEALRLLLAFAENWPVPDGSRIVKARDCEQLKLLMWRNLNGV